MKFTGKAFKFGDDVNTDYIIAGKHRSKGLDMKKLAEHLFEDLDPELVNKIKPGDLIVAGKNFGCGSSREYAAKVIIEAGISCVIAESFARIFYRNAINSGLPVIECDTSKINDGNHLQVELDAGIIQNSTNNEQITFPQIPAFMAGIISEGGLVNHLKKYGDFKEVL